ncbi:lipopolysaccharide biosynthesis protein [Halopseudomonas pertucinogena]|uniref:Polysaccharide biosynthesis protein n=1 Tax=Halopseudomonas pertucinogena TaxID=86175 RepID=A0ABQ2CQK8_9GAMM|nr:oligosaccharide flippase family protein [Halopseudomonas pertucinogena]GGI96898.1 polysaccharide biosynthesis protein [Halopseudomonas pertucinogena]
MKLGLKNKAKPKSKFVRGVSVLVGGTTIAQLLMVVISPLLTRIYSPEDFGMLAIYAALLSIAAVISGMRYELAIPLPESAQEAVSVLVLTIICVLGTTAVSAVAVWLASDLMADIMGVPQLASLLWLLPLGILLQGMFKVFNYWAIREKQYPDIARAKIFQSVVMLLVQVLGYKAGGVSLLAGHAIGQGFGSAKLARSALRRPEFKRWRWKEVRLAAVRYRKFPLFSTWEGFFNTTGSQLPPLFFAALFGAGAAGIYALAHRVIATPISILGQAVANVFFSSAAEAHREGKLGALVHSIHYKLAQIAMPPAVALMITAPEVFSVIFGEQWREAGHVARWMTPWLYLVFITSPLSTLFAVMEKQQHGMLFQVVMLISRMAAIAAGAWCDNLLAAVIYFSLASALCWTGFLLWIAHNTGHTYRMVTTPAARAAIISFLTTSPLWLALPFKNNEVVWGASLTLSACFILTHYWRLFRKVY